MYKGYRLKLTKEKMELLKEEYRVNNTANQYYGTETIGCVDDSPAYRAITQEARKNLGDALPTGIRLIGDAASKPLIKADVYIAHSVKDNDVAIAMADWLSRNFNLKVFIGTWFSEYTDEIKEALGNEAVCTLRKECKFEEMETAAISGMLMNVIDNTECFIFLDTENSEADMHLTNSPDEDSIRLYNELLTASLIRRKPSDRQLKKKTGVPAPSFGETALIPLIGTALDVWYRAYGSDYSNALDLLYKQTETK